MQPAATEVYCIYSNSVLDKELEQRFPLHHRRWITVIRDQTPILQHIIFGESPMVLVSEACHFDCTVDGVPPDYVHWGLMFTKAVLGGMSDAAIIETLKDAAKLL